MIDFNADFGDMFIDYAGFRYTDGYDDDEGGWVQGGKTPLTFIGMPTQPLSDTEIKLVQLEDGQKISDMRKLYTPFSLRGREGDKNADEITIDGNLYQVRDVSPRDTLGGHYKAIIRKIQGDAEA